jgi:hypothetical protein
MVIDETIIRIPEGQESREPKLWYTWMTEEWLKYVEPELKYLETKFYVVFMLCKDLSG